MNHRHRPADRGYRFILSKLRGDWLADHYLVQQIGPCAACWAAVADELARIIASELHGQLAPDGVMTLSGFSQDDVENWLENRIAHALDDETAA